MMKKIICIFLFVFIFGPLFAQDAIRNEWMRGYVKMEAADSAQKNNNAQEAVHLYQEALSIFKAVQRKSPSWNPSLLNYRINYCQRSIAKLTADILKESSSMSRTELQNVTEQQAMSLSQLTEERQNLLTRIDVLTESLARAREEAAKNAGLEASLQNAAEERKRLEDTIATLTLTLQDYKSQVQQLSASNRSLKEMDKLNKKLAQTEDVLKSTKTDLQKKQDDYQTLQKEDEAMQKKMANLMKNNDVLSKQLQELKDAVSSHEAQNDALNNRVDSLLKKEKELEATLRQRDKSLARLTTSNEKERKKEEEKILQALATSEQEHAQLVAAQEELLSLKANHAKLQRMYQEARQDSIRLSDQIASANRPENAPEHDLLNRLTDLQQKLNAEKEETSRLRQSLATQLKLSREQEQELASIKKQQPPHAGNDHTSEPSDKDRLLTELQQQIAVLETKLRMADRTNHGSQAPSTAAQYDELVQQCKELTQKLSMETKRNHDLEKALSEKEQLLAKNPASSQNGDDRTNIQEETDRSQLINRENQKAIQSFLSEGIRAEKDRKLEAAQWNYQKVLELDKSHRIALQRLGIIAFNQGNDLDAVKYLQQAFRADPDNQDTLFALGYALIRQSEPEWAVSNLSRAVALNPQNDAVRKTYGMALSSLGWTQAAETQFIRAFELNEKDSEAPLSLAVLLSTATPPRLPEAKKWYEIALKNGAQHDPGLDAVLLQQK